jgi:hypothetical protein
MRVRDGRRQTKRPCDDFNSRKRSDDRRRQAELEGGKRALESHPITDTFNKHGRWVRRELETVRSTNGPGGRPAKGRRKSTHEPSRHFSHIRAWKWRSRNDMIGAKRRRHRHHCQDVSCSGHRKYRLPSLCAVATGGQAGFNNTHPARPSFDERPGAWKCL